MGWIIKYAYEVAAPSKSYCAVPSIVFENRAGSCVLISAAIMTTREEEEA